MFEKGTHFAVALADERDDADIGLAVAAHGAEQCALPYPAAAENPDALPFAAGQQAVDGANTGDQRLTMCSRSSGPGGAANRSYDSLSPVRGPPSIGSPNPSSTLPSRPGPALTNAATGRATILSPSLDTAGFFERHGENAPVTEADHLHANGAALRGVNLAEVPERCRRTARFDEQADHLGDGPQGKVRFARIEEPQVTAEIEGGLRRVSHRG